MIAAYVAAASTLVASIQALLLTPPAKRLYAKHFGPEPMQTAPLENAPQGAKERLQAHVKAHGGALSFAYQVARLGASLILIALTLFSMIRERTFAPGNIALLCAIVSRVHMADAAQEC
jgi:hypothetical protein